MATYTVAITGASGAPYALRLLEVLVKGGHKIYLSMTGEGLSIMNDEAALMLKGSETDIMFALKSVSKPRKGRSSILTRTTCMRPSRAGPSRWTPWS